MRLSCHTAWLLALTLVRGAAAEPWQGDCGFAKYKPRFLTHFQERALLHKVLPVYPELARSHRLTGVVRIRVLVDRRGTVTATCPSSLPGETPADPTLVVAALEAARQWRFKPNFGLPPGVRVRGMKYADTYLVFEFTLDAAPTPKE